MIMTSQKKLQEEYFAAYPERKEAYCQWLKDEKTGFVMTIDTVSRNLYSINHFSAPDELYDKTIHHN